MTDTPSSTKDKKDKGDRKPKFNRLSFFDDTKNGVLYLTVIDKNNDYYFAYQNEAGNIDFSESVQIDGKVTCPQQLPTVNGQPARVVRVPKLELLKDIPVPDAETLKIEITNHIKKYFDAPDIEIEMFVYYILFTWFYVKTSVAPLLRFLADLGSGKSRGVEVIGDLCFLRTNLDGGTTLSSIMRNKAKWNGTVIMDEADLKKGSYEESGGYEDTFIKFLNLGFQRGKFILKTNIEDHDEQDVFDPYCPKILGMRSVFRDAATESRCLSYSPRETTRKDIPIILPSNYDDEVNLLVAKLARFTLHHWKNIDGSDFVDFSDVPVDMRTKQAALPISAIIKQVFPNGEENYKKYMLRRYDEIRRQRAQSEEGSAFNTLYAIALGEIDLKDEFPEYYPSSGENIPIRVTPAMLAKAYGVKSSNRITNRLTDTLHFEKVKERNGKKTGTVILVPNFETWQSAFNRYYYIDPEKQNPNPGDTADKQTTFSNTTDKCVLPGNLHRTREDISCPPEPKILELLEQPCSNVPNVPKHGVCIEQKCSNVPKVPKPYMCVTEKNNNNNTIHPPGIGTFGTLEHFVSVRITQDLDPFVGIDGQTYACLKGDIISLPELNASALIEREQAVLVGGS